MEKIIEDLQGITAGEMVIWGIAIVSVIIYIVKIIQKIYKSANKYFDKKHGVLDEREKVKLKLEEHDKALLDGKVKFDVIEDQLAQMLIMLKEQQESYKKDMTAAGRATLWRYHSDFTKQKYVTESGLKTFQECVERYEANGGDDIVHTKLIPEVYALELRYDLPK